MFETVYFGFNHIVKQKRSEFDLSLSERSLFVENQIKNRIDKDKVSDRIDSFQRNS